MQIRESIDKYYGGAGGETVEGLFSEFDIDDIEVDDGGDDTGAIDVSDLENAAEAGPIVRLVNMILVDAIKKNCSDIHIEPYEKEFRVRYRIDGVLYEVMKPPVKLKNALASRMKIMARLDIAERRLPQDGRIKLKLGDGKEMDYRVSVLPTLFGEKIVMRLLDKSNLQLDMTKLGFEPGPLKNFKTAIHLPYGMCLVTGPTGSGKTTTLYSALAELNKTTENISTAEDPVEFNLPGINRARWRSRSASTSPPRSAPSCARTPTSSWSARSGTSRRRRSRSRRRSPATWCSPRSTRTTRRRRSRAC